MPRIGTQDNQEKEQQVQALYAALECAPVFIHVPTKNKNHVIDVSDHVRSAGRLTDAGVRVAIAVDTGSSAHIMVHEEKIRAYALEFTIADHAHVVCKMNHNTNSPSLKIINAAVGADSHLFLQEELHVEHFFYSRCDVVLKGVGSSCKDIVRYRGSACSEIDMERAVRHEAPHTESFLDARGVAEGETCVKWRGKVRVEKQARKAYAFQRHDAMVVGLSAKVDSAPILEIFTHDISCKHSASIQRVNPEHIFYFGSRGFDEKESREEILDGFLKTDYKLEKMIT